MKHTLLLVFFVFIGLTLSAQKASKVNFSVFPNPTTEYISVEDQSEVVSEIVIYNLVGKKMKVFTYVKGDTYDVMDLPKGLYLVQIIDRQHNVLATQKVTKR